MVYGSALFREVPLLAPEVMARIDAPAAGGVLSLPAGLATWRVLPAGRSAVQAEEIRWPVPDLGSRS